MARISQLADTDLSLTRKAVQHLVYHGCVVLLDIFQFGAVYAPTAEIGDFVVDRGLGEECGRYVKVPRLSVGRPPGAGRSDLERASLSSGSWSQQSHTERNNSTTSMGTTTTGVTGSTNLDTEYGIPAPTTTTGHTDFSNNTSTSNPKDNDKIPHQTLITLYTSLRHGLTLRNWVLENRDLLHGIDVRRFITFGIIKGFLYRVHRYAVATTTATAPTTTTTATVSVREKKGGVGAGGEGVGTGNAGQNEPQVQVQKAVRDLRGGARGTRERERDGVASLATSLGDENDSLNGGNGKGGPTRPGSVLGGREKEREREREGLPLMRFLDGMSCFDEICTELEISERELENKIRGLGGVEGVWR